MTQQNDNVVNRKTLFGKGPETDVRQTVRTDYPIAKQCELVRDFSQSF